MDFYSRGFLGVLLPLLFLVSAPAGGAQADERAQIQVLRARQLAAQGRCAEALDVLADTPESARTPQLDVSAAQCEIRLQRYADASVRLEAVEARAPRTPDAALFLGVARYHLGDMGGAERALNAAQGATDDAAQLELYRGLVLLQRAETREAALALERARRSNASAVEPVASYYALLAWQAAGERARAEQALERVQRLDPDGPWARRAGETLGVGAPEPATPWWIDAELGLEYDSNVALVADNPAGLVGLASEQDDLRAVWGIDGGLGVYRGERWLADVFVGYSGSAHFDALFDDKTTAGVSSGLDASDFDTHRVSGGARVDRLLGDSALFRWQVDYTSWWVDGIAKDDFLQRYRSTKYLTQQWSEAVGATQLHVGLFLDDFKFAQFDVPGTAVNEERSRDRDGWGVVAGLQHRVPLGFAQAALTGGYNLTRKFADGSEYDYLAHEVFTALAMELPLEVRLDWRGSLSHLGYERDSTFPDGSAGTTRELRDDTLFEVSTGLTRGISQHLSVAARYYFTKANSNVKVFRYDRHIVGAYVTLHLP